MRALDPNTWWYPLPTDPVRKASTLGLPLPFALASSAARSEQKPQLSSPRPVCVFGHPRRQRTKGLIVLSRHALPEILQLWSKGVHHGAGNLRNRCTTKKEHYEKRKENTPRMNSMDNRREDCSDNSSWRERLLAPGAPHQCQSCRYGNVRMHVVLTEQPNRRCTTCA